MTPEEAAARLRRSLITDMDIASQKFTDYCKPYRNSIGLVADNIKSGEEYKRLQKNYYITRDKLQLFNNVFTGKEYKKAFKKETEEHYKKIM